MGSREASLSQSQRGGGLATPIEGAKCKAGSMADVLLVSYTPEDRAAWLELCKMTQARGQLLQDAEITLRVHRDLLEVLTQVQV